MRLNAIIYVVLVLFVTHERCAGLFGGASLQDYIDRVVDVAKLHFDTVASMNDSTISNIFNFFKSKYGRVYSSLGLCFDSRK